MENPVNTIIFSPPFLGNGDRFVTTGPFANWQLPNLEPLSTRNIGTRSTLFSKVIINTILTRCRTIEISAPTAQVQFDLDRAHGGPHNWVGGHMEGLNTAAHDPVFSLHHAFIGSCARGVSGVASFITTDKQLQSNRGCCFRIQTLFPEGFPFFSLI